MIVENIAEAKIALEKEIFLNFKRYILYSFTSIISVLLSAVMFFYVEECYFMVKIPTQYSQNCQELCSGIEKLNGTVPNQSTNITQNVRDLMEICNRTGCIEVPGKQQTTCRISNLSHYLKFYELALSIIFTIGYGRTVAKSMLGKCLVMTYATFSIPITTASVVFCGRFITAVIKYFVISFESRVLKHNKITKFQRKVTSIIVMLNTLVILMLALLYHMTSLQNHGFFEAFYFTFISLTTIGFGDTDFVENLNVTETCLFIALDWLLFYSSYSMLASLIGMAVSFETERPTKS
ncbi:potassium channel subfamily K member 9-like [Clytia hemisphaerica]|uniref:potassium channel subfamily K member 9-like n=1 Tax=Clytia hemisphaerica TaxID=252671 RepID=UPI0034D5C100